MHKLERYHCPITKKVIVLYREDIKTAFGYSLVGIAAVLGLTGIIYGL
ncbi:2745_t:CDS:2 [Ambispora leptoticha]|uniref:2745_t:CDS:1 n=1 Tax=Ambispora leptoticha TaxID=144679 RepID=A0A9N9FS33_9GLOM|nr:2745_t:CDS:2 [Ambispora leptoticha]